jgi:hypothetical protein
LGIDFQRCEGKSEKSASKFVPSSNYHKEEETLKFTKTHYPSDPKLFFNPKREVRKETHKPREEAFICMFCSRAGYLDEFCFCRKRMEKRCFDYAKNSYCDEFIDFPPHTSSRASSHFFMELTITHMVLVHERISLWLDTLLTAHVLIMVIIPRVGMVFPQEVPILTLSRVALTVHTFSIVVHVPLAQMVRCKGL